MVQYAVKKINLEKVKNVDDYWNQVNNATIKYTENIVIVTVQPNRFLLI